MKSHNYLFYFSSCGWNKNLYVKHINPYIYVYIYIYIYIYIQYIYICIYIYVYIYYLSTHTQNTKSKKPLTEAIESVSLVTSFTKCFWRSWGAFAHFSSLQITQQTPDWGQDSGLAFLKFRASSVWTLSFSFTPVSLLCCKSRRALSFTVHHTAVQPNIHVVRSSLHVRNFRSDPGRQFLPQDIRFISYPKPRQQSFV